MKKGSGRPKQLTETIHFRVSKDMYKKLQALAAADGLEPSQLLRSYLHKLLRDE